MIIMPVNRNRGNVLLALIWNLSAALTLLSMIQAILSQNLAESDQVLPVFDNVMRYSQAYTELAPGIPPERQVVFKTTGYKSIRDGRSCITGQEPWNPAETAAYKIFLTDLWKGGPVTEPDMLGYYALADNSWSQVIKELSEPCKNSSCYLDGVTWTFTCGTPKFEDGTSCVVGTNPLTDPDVKRAEKAANKEPYPVSTSKLKYMEMNQSINGHFSGYCKSKQCFVRLIYWTLMPLCDPTPPSISQAIQPLFVLVTVSLGVRLLLNLPHL